jgi:hypothetical protein
MLQPIKVVGIGKQNILIRVVWNSNNFEAIFFLIHAIDQQNEPFCHILCLHNKLYQVQSIYTLKCHNTCMMANYKLRYTKWEKRKSKQQIYNKIFY